MSNTESDTTEWTEPELAALWTPYESLLRAGRELRHRNRFLFAVTVLNVALAVLFTALIQLDGRVLLGRNVWTKPWKFATSIAIFTATIGWLLPSVSLGDRPERRVSYIIGTAMLIEIALISGQAARGVPSHFNRSTLFDTLISLVMVLTITVSTLTVAYVFWRVTRTSPSLSTPYLWGIRGGLLIFLIASFEGYLIVINGAHSVGTAPSAPGLPLLNWKLTGGDLRIAHFIGLHGLQVLPLTGYVVSRWDRVSERGALGLVSGVSALYGLLVAAVFGLALVGHPLASTVPSVDSIFSQSVLLVAPFWILMIFAPTWSWTERLADSHLIVLPAAFLYGLLVATQIDTVAATLFSPTLVDLMALLSSELGTTTAWVHFLAFDLFVGRWIYRDGRDREMPPYLLSPLLFLTLLFGPVGFLGYCILRPLAAN
jgi:hypothetical protein